MTALDRVLVVSGSIGKGHDTVAEACVQALGVDATIVDAVALLGQRGGSFGQAIFRRLLGRPALYDAFHFTHLRGGTSLAHALDRMSCHKMYPRVAAKADELDAELILAVFATGAAAAARYKQSHPHVVTAVVCTDSFAHHLWVHDGIDLFVVTSHVGAEAVRLHRPDARVAVITHPVRRAFYEVPDRIAARTAIGVPPDARCVLLMAGGWGIGPLEASARRLTELGMHVIAIAGSNRPLEVRLRAVARSVPHLHPMGYTDQVGELMAASDIVVTTSGDTCREARVVGRYLVIIDTVPGHGRENLQHELELGQASACRSDADAVGACVQAVFDRGDHLRSNADRDAARWEREFRTAFESLGLALPPPLAG
jgi:UDP-N-acetylglucosamine:LPS N-acetylglucosamine transferase